jgi:protein TonB
MVADPDLDIRELVRWGGLLTLSLFAHLFLFDMFSLKPISFEQPIPQHIKISLSALAAPKIDPSPQPAPKTKATPTQRIEPTPAPAAPLAFEQTQSSSFEVAHTVKTKPEPEPKADPIPTPRLVSKKPKLPIKKQIASKAPQKVVPDAPKAEQKIIKKAAELAPKPSSKAAPATKPLANQTGQSNATVIHEANYRRRTAPSYPRRAYELGQQGIVTLAALVSPNGKTGQLKIEHSSGHRLLDRAAMAAVKKWEFEPLIQDGKKVSSWVRVPVKFVIN